MKKIAIAFLFCFICCSTTLYGGGNSKLYYSVTKVEIAQNTTGFGSVYVSNGAASNHGVETQRLDSSANSGAEVKVKLWAVADEGSSFVGWTYDSKLTAQTIILTNANPYTVTVKVSSSPGTIDTTIFYGVFSKSAYVDGGGSLILSYNDTALTKEQIAAINPNPVKVIYPTSMKDKIPVMQCKELGSEEFNDTLTRYFVIGPQRRVRFSKGNLQFNAAQGTHKCADGKTKKGTWRFAENQLDYVGNAKRGNVYYNGVKCNNDSASANYDGWIDFFGWGTSGYDNTANDPYAVNYEPWSKGTTNVSESYNTYGYGPSTNMEDENLVGTSAYYDWGQYNQIGTDTAGTWRLLTKDEWEYILSKRNNYAALKINAVVDGDTCKIIFPSKWKKPEGVTYTAGESYMNELTVEDVQMLISAGAVVLPHLSPYINNETYHTSTADGVKQRHNFAPAYAGSFGGILMPSTSLRCNGGYVRLVKDL